MNYFNNSDNQDLMQNFPWLPIISGLNLTLLYFNRPFDQNKYIVFSYLISKPSVRFKMFADDVIVRLGIFKFVQS